MTKYIDMTFSKKANSWNVYVRYKDTKKSDISEYIIDEEEAKKRLEELKIKENKI